MAPSVQSRADIPTSSESPWFVDNAKDSTPGSQISGEPQKEARLVEVVRQQSKESIDGSGSKSGRRQKWLSLLKSHKAAGCLSWIGIGAINLFERRLSTKGPAGRSESFDTRASRRRRIVLRALLAILAALLLVNAISLMHIRKRFGVGINMVGLTAWVAESWRTLRVLYVAPALQVLCDSCVYMFLLQSADRLLLFLGCIWVKLRNYKPRAKGSFSEAADLEEPGASYPRVLVQLPMCNEREVYHLSITAACKLDWPKDRLLIQVLDDSTNPDIQKLIEAKCKTLAQKGAPLIYHHRHVRAGFKAGNLHNGMQRDYVKEYEFVAIFDADFRPRPDFLKQTVVHFKEQPDLGLVQARWAYVNKDVNLLTKLQNINLRFHFEVEQQVNGAFISFFGFNGTAGVWRITAIEDSGGWMDRTTVDDMDIAVRAHLRGWRMTFLNDVEVLCELPESYGAYKTQQHRWHSGPMQLFKLVLPDILKAKIATWKKFNLVVSFFVLRKMLLPFYSFTLFCVALPLAMFVPEVSIPNYVICYVAATMSILTILPSPGALPLLVPYLLFENCMSVTKFSAMVAGLFQPGSTYEWVVTRKSGRSSQGDLPSPLQQEVASPAMPAKDETAVLLAKATSSRRKHGRKIFWKELLLALLLLVAAAQSVINFDGMHFYFLLFQGLAFLVTGFDLITRDSK